MEFYKQHLPQIYKMYYKYILINKNKTENIYFTKINGNDCLLNYVLNWKRLENYIQTPFFGIFKEDNT